MNTRPTRSARNRSSWNSYGVSPSEFAADVGLPHLAVEHDLAVADLQRRAGALVARLELPQPRRQLVEADRHEDEVVGAHLRVQARDARDLDAEQDPGRDQLRPLPQPPDRVAPDLEVLARFDQRHVDGTGQLAEVITDDLDPVAEAPHETPPARRFATRYASGRGSLLSFEGLIRADRILVMSGDEN